MEFNRISVTKEIDGALPIFSFCIEDVEKGISKNFDFQKGVLPCIKIDDFNFSISSDEYERLDEFLIPGITCVINTDNFIKSEGQGKDDIKDEYEEEKQEITTDNVVSEGSVKETNKSICITKKNILPSILTAEPHKVGLIYKFFNKPPRIEGKKRAKCDHEKRKGIIDGIDTRIFMSLDFYLKKNLEEFKDVDIIIKRTNARSVAKVNWLEHEKLFLISPYAGNLKAFIFIKYEDFTTAHNREENLIELDKVEGKYMRLTRTKKNINIIEKIKRGEPGYSIKKF